MTIDLVPRLTPVETRSRTQMIRVDVNGKPVGLIEKLPAQSGYRHPWKAFVGIGFECKYVSAHYGRTGKQDAVDAVLVAANL